MTIMENNEYKDDDGEFDMVKQLRLNKDGIAILAMVDGEHSFIKGKLFDAFPDKGDQYKMIDQTRIKDNAPVAFFIKLVPREYTVDELKALKGFKDDLKDEEEEPATGLIDMKSTNNFSSGVKAPRVRGGPRKKKTVVPEIFQNQEAVMQVQGHIDESVMSSQSRSKTPGGIDDTINDSLNILAGADAVNENVAFIPEANKSRE